MFNREVHILNDDLRRFPAFNMFKFTVNLRAKEYVKVRVDPRDADKHLTKTKVRTSLGANTLPFDDVIML